MLFSRHEMANLEAIEQANYVWNFAPIRYFDIVERRQAAAAAAIMVMSMD
jgi:hypothetical protein